MASALSPPPCGQLSAVSFFGAVEALGEKRGVEVSWSAWRALNERALTVARGQINAEAFEAAWAEGRSLTLEEVVAQALAEDV